MPSVSKRTNGATTIQHTSDIQPRERLISADVLEQAFSWLCRQRKHWPADADVWNVRAQWRSVKQTLIHDLGNGTYRFDPMARITKANGEILHVWCARDAVVLKAMALVLGDVLPQSARCTHVKGHGGAKAAVRAVAEALPDNRFVIRTDVRQFYESIDQHLLIDALAKLISDRFVLNLLWQVMRRNVTWGGLFKECQQGISRGCPLSPLLSGFVLYQLDNTMERTGLFYVRYMDDFVILAPTRWRCRRAMKQINTELANLNLEKHPDKTFIGRIEKGFDFLGYHIHPDGLTLAKATVERFIEKATRLYEQGTHSGALGLYVQRFTQWCNAGFGVTVDKPLLIARLNPCSDSKTLHGQLAFLSTQSTEGDYARA